MPATNGTLPAGSGPTRRKLLTTAAWAAPAVLIAVAAPAASASTNLSTLSFKGLYVDFESDKYPFYTIGVELRANDVPGLSGYRPVTSASVEIEFEPADAPFVFDVKNYGDGWDAPVLLGNKISLYWAGPAMHAGTNENHAPPIQFKVKGTSAAHLTTFSITAASPDAHAVVVLNQAVTGFES